MVTISTRVRRFNELLAIAEAHDNVFCSVGTHPHNAAEEPDIMVEELVELARHPKVVAIGEAGLDYHYDNSPRDMQKKGFRTHIAAARETGLPLVIHAREADADIARILEEETEKGAFPFVLHCFTGSPELARRGLPLAAMSPSRASSPSRMRTPYATSRWPCRSTGSWSRPTRPTWRQSPCAGKANEPAFVAHTAARLAALRDLSEAEMARVTTENFFRLFKKVPRSA